MSETLPEGIHTLSQQQIPAHWARLGEGTVPAALPGW